MSQDLPIGDMFGNYWIKGIAEIRQPDPVSWAPAAPGWIGVGVIFSGVVFWLLSRLFRMWRRNTYRRRALVKFRRLQKQKALDETVFLRALPLLLKETAICAYPESDAASLTGVKWLDFLEKQVPGAGFAKEIGRYLVLVAYQDPRKWTITSQETKTLASMVEHWIRRHRTGDCHA